MITMGWFSAFSIMCLLSLVGRVTGVLMYHFYCLMNGLGPLMYCIA